MTLSAWEEEGGVDRRDLTVVSLAVARGFREVDAIAGVGVGSARGKGITPAGVADRVEAKACVARPGSPGRFRARPTMRG